MKQNQDIQSVAVLSGILKKILKDKTIIQKSCKENPWFTPFYVQHAADAILPWLDERVLKKFISAYPKPKGDPLNIALIFAGNLPFVGIHDLMMTILSGNNALIRFSSKDKILTEYILKEWMRICPEISERIEFFPWKTNPEYLIATGSDNTARYTEYEFRNIPRIIRKNRFSVALLDGNESRHDLHQLAWDIFLYNGMGCRNVSNLLVPEGYDLHPLIDILNRYPAKYLSAAWKEMLVWEKAKLMTLNAHEKIADQVIYSFSTELRAIQPGYLNVVTYKSPYKAHRFLKHASKHIQCVVGNGLQTAFGKSQFPALNDFQDGTDVIGEIYKIREKIWNAAKANT